MDNLLVPREVVTALHYVRSKYDCVDTVIFLKDGTWRYFDSTTLNAPMFADNIDVSVLEQAVDSVPYLPFIAQI